MKKRGMKVYFIHSDKLDYNNVLYLPVLRSNYLSNHTLLFASTTTNKDKYYKDMIKDTDLIVVELSSPDLGFNMQIKEAIISKKPILALANKNVGYDPKYSKLLNNILVYSNEEEVRTFVEKFVESYEGRIIKGQVDNTLVLGVLNQNL